MVLNGNVIHNKILQRFYTSHYVEMFVYGIIMQKKYLYCRCRYIKRYCNIFSSRKISVSRHVCF
jgi:hypothetical protein